MPDLSNCTVCGKLYVRSMSSVCPTCQKEVDIKFSKVYDFIRKKANREATILEVHEATGVEEDLIIEFIKEGRLRTTQMINFKYPCESCGLPISEGTLCDDCQKGFRHDLSAFESQREVFEKLERDKANYRTYYTKPKK